MSCLMLVSVNYLALSIMPPNQLQLANSISFSTFFTLR
jgi:hypothetical protein